MRKEDESLFDIENGKLLVQRVTTQVRVIEARYKGIVMTLEINFGITGVDEIGNFTMVIHTLFHKMSQKQILNILDGVDIL